MTPAFHLLPEQASDMARRVDALLYFMLAVSAVVTLLVVGFVTFFSVRYRKRRGDEGPLGPPPRASTALELACIGAPLGLSLFMFGWGADLLADMKRPPADSMDVYIVGRRWMWKAQHLGGKREINQLHVPLGRPVKLTMTSEDVIHSFYLPAFRVKQDVLPGRYTTMWIEADRPGTYPLYCAEYCGTKHAQMTGEIVVLPPRAFEEWLGGPGEGSLAGSGAKLFESLGCSTCHRADTLARGPSLAGLFGSPVELTSGDTITADEDYLRESILDPRAKVVAGYQPIMPTYAGQVSEEGIVTLLAYLKTLRAPAPAPAGGQERKMP